MEQYNVHDVADIMEAPPEAPVARVEVVGTIRTDELPTETEYRRVVLRAGAPAEKILQHDERRKRVVMWLSLTGTGADCVCVGSTSGQAQSYTGALLTSPNATTRYESTDRGDVWARAGDMQNPAATFNGVIPSTTDVVLSMFIEQWSR